MLSELTFMGYPLVTAGAQLFIAGCVVINTIIFVLGYKGLQRRFNASEELLHAAREMLMVTKIYQKLCYQQQEQSKKIVEQVPSVIKEAVNSSVGSSGEFRTPVEFAQTQKGESEASDEC